MRRVNAAMRKLMPFGFAFEAALLVHRPCPRICPDWPLERTQVHRMTGRRASGLPIALGSIALAAALAAPLIAAAAPARAEAYILVDADSGKVLRAENAGYPWYPASTSKLMTLFVTLSAIRDNRITFDTLFTVSRNA